MSRFKPALQPEILRAHQKDEQHILSLQKDVSEIARAVLGMRPWMRWRLEVDALASLIYYCATTLSGFQTLGEEYVHILQLGRSLKTVPTLAQRLTFVVLQSFGSNLIRGTLKLIKKEQKVDGEALSTLVTRALQVHTILFYLLGGYYSPAKRLSGIRYVLIRNWLSTPDVARYYKVLGWLSLIEFGVSLQSAFRSLKTSGTSDNIHSELSKYSCCMCVDSAKNASVIPCGHVYCWYCITGWLRTNKQCPLCRMPCEPQQTVLLQNVW
ncbi:peroxisome assembly protein 10-B-like [Dermacentor variabilis]|uniref:peroxisome assembly protein 10-B-like n=1 Tax=Dermacentor variabilis TaxID=34621 RepID=UPI003F5B136E